MFYGGEDGNKLVDEANYPISIKKYLENERKIVLDRLNGHDLLIEVGCMEARNMECALNNGKKYIGIDIVEEYIKIAKEIVKKRELGDRCEFLCIDAEKLDDILNYSKLMQECSAPLFFFPFNSFGNMRNFNRVLDSISKIKNADFLIFSYDTDERSTSERFKYYNNCDYDNLHVLKESTGIRFIADNGLNSMAYNKEFLGDEIKCRGIDFEIIKFSDIGIVYSISTRKHKREMKL